MWIIKPLIAIVSGAVFVISVLLTAIGIAVLLAVDIPKITILSDAKIINIIVIAVAMSPIVLSHSVVRDYFYNFSHFLLFP